MIAVTGAVLPVSTVAQTTTEVTDLIKKLQSEIGTIEKQHQAEITTIQKQYQTEIRSLQKQHQGQIQNLQKQLDELKAAQAAPRASPPPAAAAAAGLTVPSSGGPLPPPAAAAAQARTQPEQAAQAAAQPPSAGVQSPAPGKGGPEIIVGVPPPGLPLPSAGVHVLEPAAGRFGIESADGRNAIFLTGRLHFDVADYLDYTPASQFAAVQDLDDWQVFDPGPLFSAAERAQDQQANLSTLLTPPRE